MGSGPTKHVGPRVILLPPEREGESCIIRNYHSKDGLVARTNDNVATLHDAFVNSVKKYPQNKCIGHRVGNGPYKWLSYNDTFTRVKYFGAGLLNLGMVPHEDRVGIFSINRYEWIITEQACNAYSLCIVPLYDALTPDACSFLINQSGIGVIVCSPDKINLLLHTENCFKQLKVIIHFDTVTEDIKIIAAEKNIELYSFDYLVANGKANPQQLAPPKPEELSTICYTSGTTGNPKGAMITHANLISVLAGVILNGVAAVETDVHISYLPLAHVFERLTVTSLIYSGGSIGFFSGDIGKLCDDIKELKPTIFISVPRIWNRIYDNVKSAVNEFGTIKKTLFETAYEAKRNRLQAGNISHPIYDVMFSTIKAKLGGNVRIMVTGSAPMSDQVMEFLRICYSVPVIEGYGQTETSAVATTTLVCDTNSGHVGVPLACIELKLVDIPEMSYFTTDKPYPRGEICFRGPSVSKGYFNDLQQTEQAWDKYGWLHSGDIGSLNEEGNLKIIDRKKNIFKLTQGEYLAPEKIENVYAQSKFVLQCWVHGDPLKSQCIAIVVPNQEVVKYWAKENNLPEDMEQLLKNHSLKMAIIMDMEAKASEAGLKAFEMVKAVHLSAEAFSIENELLTPLLKIKRQKAREYFSKQIEELYSHLE